jgi:Arc/MetJ-type ribon-helix-helix transcriptional regulator
MPPAKSSSTPLAIQLEVEFLDRMSEPVRDGKAKSVSEIIRAALERFDFANVLVVHPAQLQVSVRLPGEIRQMLRKVSRTKHTSIGQLVRAAVEAYLPQLEAHAAGQLEMPIVAAPVEGAAAPAGPAQPPSRVRRKRPAARPDRRARRRGTRTKAMTKKRKG